MLNLRIVNVKLLILPQISSHQLSHLCQNEHVLSAHADSTCMTMALAWNQPLCYIQSSKQVLQTSLAAQAQTPLVRFAIQLVVQLPVQQIDKKLNQWSFSHTVHERHVCHWPLTARGAVNTVCPLSGFISHSPTVSAMAKFSKSRVWDKVPKGSTLIFEDTLISLHTA